MQAKLENRLSQIRRNAGRNLLTGVIIITPLVVTVLVMLWLFNFIDGILRPVLEPVLGAYVVPGVGLIVLLILVYLIGLLATNVLGRRFIEYAESMVNKLPVVREVYNTVRRVLDSITLPQKTGGFKEVVLVEFPRAGMRTIAFVTGRIHDSAGREMLNLYIPTAPNPTSGFFEISYPEQVTKTSMSVDSAMKLILSAGVVTPAILDVAFPDLEKQEGYGR